MGVVGWNKLAYITTVFIASQLAALGLLGSGSGAGQIVVGQRGRGVAPA